MARIRTIKPEFWTNEKVMECKPLTRLLFIGMWNFADDYGRMPFAPMSIKARVFPNDPFTAADIRDMLSELCSSDLLMIYSAGDKEYIEITGWEHQKIDKRQVSKLPGPFEAGSDVKGGNSPNPADFPRTPPTPAAVMEGNGGEGKGKDMLASLAVRAPSRFEDFWKAYPRREGANPRKPAESKFNALVKSGADPEMMIAAARQLSQAESAKGNIGTRFIPMASTWLNQQRWADHAALAFLASETEMPIEDAVKFFAKVGRWSRWAGPEPGQLGCKASDELLAKHGLAPDGRKLETMAQAS